MDAGVTTILSQRWTSFFFFSSFFLRQLFRSRPERRNGGKPGRATPVGVSLLITVFQMPSPPYFPALCLPLAIFYVVCFFRSLWRVFPSNYPLLIGIRRGIIPFACIYARGRPTATTCRQCGNKTSTDSYGHSSHDPKPSLESIHRDIDRRFTRRCIRQTGFSAILGTVSKPTAGSRKRPILLVARPPPPRLLDYGWQKPSAEQCGIRRMHPPNSCCGTRDAPFLSSRWQPRSVSSI